MEEEKNEFAKLCKSGEYEADAFDLMKVHAKLRYVHKLDGVQKFLEKSIISMGFHDASTQYKITRARKDVDAVLKEYLTKVDAMNCMYLFNYFNDTNPFFFYCD